jgi:putative methanogenesis marker protein 3
MIAIQVDGERREIPDGSVLSDILPEKDTVCAIAVIRPGTQEAGRSQNLQVSTTAGEIVIEMTVPVVPVDLDNELVPKLALHWADRYAAAFGPFESTIMPSRTPYLYERGDVILGCGGYDPKTSYIVFAKLRHASDVGAQAGGGVVGRVVSGKGVIDRWSTGDHITRIEPVIAWADTSRSFATTDMGLPLEDGMQIITYIKVAALGYNHGKIETGAALSVEHLLMAMEQGHFVVGRSSSTHIMDERLASTYVPEEIKEPRREGAVTVRTRGRERGSVYIYTADVPGSPAHSTVGQVEHGIELARLAREGHILCIRTEPERFDLVGHSLSEARVYAHERGITISDGKRQDAGVVVDQKPGSTLEVLAGGAVQLTTVPLEKVIGIVLDDLHAPVSCTIFRKLTGLDTHNIGRLPLYFHFEDVYLFKPELPTGVRINPENLPRDTSPANALAITNDSRQGVGLVGIRLGESREFGPTSEPFEGTNLLGTVVDIGKLKHIREKEIVYIREERR